MKNFVFIALQTIFCLLYNSKQGVNMFDIGIIGAGPAGYSAAIRASQLGLKVVLFEKEFVGGTCLNRGCIPTKTILHSVNVYSQMKNANKLGILADNVSFDFAKIQERQKSVSEKIRKNLFNLIKSYGVEIVESIASIEDEHHIVANNNSYEVKNIIIATGSKPNNIKFNGNYESDFVKNSDDILNLTELPKSVLIVGSGAIGVEWTRIFSALGVKVIVVDMAEKLIPPADTDVSDRVARLFKRNRIEFYTSTTISSIENKTVKLSNDKSFEVDFVMLGAGRLPVLDFGKISSSLKIEKYIVSDENFKTNYENIYAIGDVNGASMLAHSAVKQAEEVIDYILEHKNCSFDKNLVPSVIYGTPEIAWVGKTEFELQKDNIEYKKSVFPVSALGKAYAEDKIEGFIKILATDTQILGAHIISEEASALIQQIAIAMNNNILPKDMLKVIYAHPTYSEGVSEAIAGLYKLALNLPKQ